MSDLRNYLIEAGARLGDRLEAEVLVAEALGRTRSWLVAHADHSLEEGEITACETLLRRRLNGEPVAYILGRRGFWTLDLEVDRSTLIPRPDTELLVEQVLQRLPLVQAVRLADLGTGSGAVALAVAAERPHWSIVATDISVAALQVAGRNARRLGLERVLFAEGDWLQPLRGQLFDAIVSNPPYIEATDPHLALGDLRFEPLGALASGPDGLLDIRRITASAHEYLYSQGWLIFEHGWTQGEAVRGLLVDAGYLEIFTARDLEGRERVSGGRRP